MNELQTISIFRSLLITKQQQLYEFVVTTQYNIEDVIKFEPADIKIETQSSEENVNPFVFGKETVENANKPNG